MACDSGPLLLFRFCHACRKNFAIEVSCPCLPSPSSSIVDNWATIWIYFQVVQFLWFSTRILYCVQTFQTSSNGILVLVNKISSHLSNSWTMLSFQRNNNIRRNQKWFRVPVTRKSRRSWRRSVFLEKTGPQSELSFPPDRPSSWSGNSEWSGSKQKHFWCDTSRNL